jgi:hypothetical protein
VVERETLMEMKAQKKPASKEVAGASTPEKTAGKHPGSKNLMPPWKPGQSGSPKGRPKGSRNKLSAD